MPVDLTAANQLPPKSDELFRIFARFEFALKMAGFTSPKPDGKFDVDWNTFANSAELGPAFLAEVQASGIAATILGDPPMHQRLVHGALAFVPAAPPDAVQAFVGAVCRVRNNLFHGGKFFPGNDDDRNTTLVSEAIASLLLALEKHEAVRAYFEGRLPS
ncbi:MAG: hypothetical protein E5X41_30620 [Mesorhizobium sp.]|nr:MAG: hypothetical protein E5X41_30620 [Mesorhizobium sp.]